MHTYPTQTLVRRLAQRCCRQIQLLTISGFSLLASQAFAAWVQPNIPGAVSGVTQYRIIFSTKAHGNTAFNWSAGTSITPFNQMVQTAANSDIAKGYGLPQYTDGTSDGHLGGTALTWACLGSTVDGQPATNNVANTLPDWNNYGYFYNTAGAMVTSPTLRFFGDAHLAGAGFAEDGTDNYGSDGNYRVCTGGTYGAQNGTLGNASAIGRTNPTSTGVANWFWQNNYGPAGCGLYAVSGLITWYSTTTTLPAPEIALTNAEPMRLMLGTSGIIGGYISNSAAATGTYNNARLSDLSGQASNGLGISGWDPAGPYTVGIGAAQFFTATINAGWNLNGQNGSGFVKIYTVKVDDGAGSAATVSKTLQCLDNRAIKADAFAVHAHAGYTGSLTFPVELKASNLADNITTTPKVVDATYTTPDGLVSITSTATVFKANATLNTLQVTLHPGASSTVLNLALDNGVGANLVQPEGLAGESINGRNICPTGTANISYPSNRVDLPITIYSGLSEWNVNAGGNWSTFTNWTQSGGVPGIDGALSANDTATFGPACNAGFALVTMDVNASLKALNFNNTVTTFQVDGPGTLTLSNGTSPVVIDVTGTHWISATLTLPTGIPLRKTGPGTLIMAAPPSYTGSSLIEAGVLNFLSPDYMPATPVAIGATGQLSLSYGNATVPTLQIEGLSKPAGVYGASGSGAENIDDTHFAGSGTLTVTGVAPPVNDLTITSITTDSSGNLIISATSSQGVTVKVLSSSDVATPMASWTEPAGVTYPTFPATTFSITVPKPTAAQGFYRLQVQ